MSDFFKKQELIPRIGKAGQAKLLSTNVLILGCGKESYSLLTALSGSGIAKMSLYDEDNAKAVEAKEHAETIIHQYDPHAAITVVDSGYDVKNYDLVLVCNKDITNISAAHVFYLTGKNTCAEISYNCPSSLPMSGDSNVVHPSVAQFASNLLAVEAAKVLLNLTEITYKHISIDLTRDRCISYV